MPQPSEPQSPSLYSGDCRGTKFDIPKCFWHVYYFKLKTVKAQDSGRNSDLPSNCLENSDRGPIPGIEGQERCLQRIQPGLGEQLPEIRAHSASLSVGPTNIHLPINLLFHLHVNCLPLLKSPTPLLPTSSLVFS